MLQETLAARLLPASASAPWLSAALAVALIALLAAYLYRSAYDRPPNFPPGPPRLPLWGNYLQLLWLDYDYMHKSLLELRRRYKTDVLGFFLGDFPSVALFDYDDIKEMFSRPEFAGRPDVIVGRERSQGKRAGVIFADGPKWLELRRFMLRYLRDYGWGRRLEASEVVMTEEVRDVVDLLRGEWHDDIVSRAGGRIKTSELAAPFVFNAMWHMFAGERRPRGEHGELRAIVRAVTRFFRVTCPSGTAISLTEWLRFWPRRWNLDDVHETNEPLRQFVRRSVAEHKATIQRDCPRDFIDVYLIKMDEMGLEEPDVFSDQQLLLTSMDMMTASVAALTFAIAYLWQQLLHHPQVQEKLQEEVDRVVGRGRPATLDDRQDMPYTEATIRESLRRVTVAPVALPHVALEDTTIAGYDIPKGTLLYPHVGEFHMNEAVWGDPENFRPERFLEEDGSLKRKDITLPFGHGKRLCPGETFSRHMMFLLLSNVMQNFTVRPDGPLPAIDASFPGFTPVPVDLWAIFEPRL